MFSEKLTPFTPEAFPEDAILAYDVAPVGEQYCGRVGRSPMRLPDAVRRADRSM
jgi:hypothetical protein